MQQLSELRYAWTSVQHQRETLSTIYSCHSELVKSLASNPMRYSPVFHLEDFFGRYSDLPTGQGVDGAHVSFRDVREGMGEYMGHDLYAPRTNSNSNGQPSIPLHDERGVQNQNQKRRFSTPASKRKHLELKVNLSHRNSENGHAPLLTPSTTLPDEPQSARMGNAHEHGMMLEQHTPITPFPPHSATSNGNGNGMPSLSHTPFSPPYSFSALPLPGQEVGVGNGFQDPMFGMGTMGWMTPAHGTTPSHANANGNGNGNGMGEEMGQGDRRRESESEGEKDPFLSLLEQLAENEHSRGGPSELDFFLSGANG